MPNGKMDPIEVENTIVGKQWALSPAFKLFGERLVEAADRAGTRGHPHEGLSYFSHFVGTHPSHKHLRQPFCYLRFIPTVALSRRGSEIGPPDLSGRGDHR